MISMTQVMTMLREDMTIVIHTEHNFINDNVMSSVYIEHKSMF